MGMKSGDNEIFADTVLRRELQKMAESFISWALCFMYVHMYIHTYVPSPWPDLV
jgi:hypothetical protein